MAPRRKVRHLCAEVITGRDEKGTRADGVGATLDELVRAGAQRMITAALRIEADEYVARYRERRDADGHAVVVRNGCARPRPADGRRRGGGDGPARE